MRITDIVCSKAIALEQYALLKHREPSISATIGECIKKYPELSGRIDSTDRAFEEKPFSNFGQKDSKKSFRKPYEYFCNTD